MLLTIVRMMLIMLAMMVVMIIMMIMVVMMVGVLARMMRDKPILLFSSLIARLLFLLCARK